MEDNYVVILGPTASGKTAISIELAKRLSGEIISADSMLIYKGMDIGTAKPTEEEKQNIPHHLIDIINPDDEFSVYDYQVISQQKIKEIKKRSNLPIVVGGTGLFIRALTEDFSLNDIPQNNQIRLKYQEIMEEKGKEYLHGLLEKKDPKAFLKLHPNDYRRVIRAHEVFDLSGQSIYHLQQREKKQENILYVGLTMERPKLYERINQRVELMLNSGLVEEVDKLLKKGVSKDSNAMKGIGYRQVLHYLEGTVGYDEMVETLKKDTRRYAKRQLTWFNSMDDVYWIDLTKTTLDSAITKIIDLLQEKEIISRIL